MKPILIQAGDEFAVADIAGEPGGPIDIGIKMPPFQPTDYLLLSFRGLPKRFSLSSGFRTAEAWLVSAHEARNLQLVPPDGFIGDFDLEVQLIRGQNIEPLIHSVRVSIQPQRAAQQIEQPPIQDGPASIPTAAVPEQNTASDDPSSTVSVTKTNPVSPEKERQLLAMAREMLDQKDISAARLIYARLARKGSVKGALTLAQTYDPAFLSHYDVTGLAPDMEKAKHWYGIAAGLGSEDASGRLIALEGTGRR